MRNVLIIPPRSAAEAIELMRDAQRFGLDAVAEEFETEAIRLAQQELERNAAAPLSPWPQNTNVH